MQATHHLGICFRMVASTIAIIHTLNRKMMQRYNSFLLYPNFLFLQALQCSIIWESELIMLLLQTECLKMSEVIAAYSPLLPFEVALQTFHYEWMRW